MSRAKPRAVTTSDVTRPRAVGLAALGAAAGAGIVLASSGVHLGGERPLPRPHEKNHVACAKCHTAPEGASPAAFASSGACKGCHHEHPSTRAGHRAMAAKGELTCATCHPPHAGAQGVTFADNGAFVRWGAGAEITGTTPMAVKAKTTVPLVALAACAKCHDPTRAGDPIAQCVPADVRAGTKPLKTTPSSCFDEHATLKTGGDRFVAWDAARSVARETPWVAAKAPESPPWAPAMGATLGAAALGLVATALDRRRKRPAAAPAPAAPAAVKRLPVIDPSTCLGCYACVDACPFDVIAIDRYVAYVARPEECCGVVLCEQVCPNGSLRIAEGEPVLDRPAIAESLESADVPGVFLAGDLTGLPLIKNAINQGVRALDGAATSLGKRRGKEPFDVIVVGAGPAGLSAALRAKEKGLSCVVVEQATIAASVKSFPRDKIVHDPPLDLPVEGELWLREATKEELLAQWSRIVRARGLDVREGRRVTAVDKDGDAFVVRTEGETFRGARVVLAIGRRGTPRAIDVAIEPGAESRVAYALADARSFAGKRVVVVGLGDSAMEAAVALARQPDTSVTIAYRGEGFRRGKARNIDEVRALVDKGRIRILFETVPVAISRTAVTLDGAKGRRTLQADAVLVLIGGMPSWDLLTRCGIRRPDRKEEAPKSLDPSAPSDV